MFKWLLNSNRFVQNHLKIVYADLNYIQMIVKKQYKDVFKIIWRLFMQI